LTYQFLWQKIEQELKKMKVRKNTEIIFSPDGIYNQINPNTIFNPKKNRFLIDEYSFFNVSSGRIIAQEGIADKREEDFKNYQIFLFGNPKFDDENEKTEEPAVRKDRSRALFNSILQKGVKVAELPGTEKEVAKISELISQEGIKNQVFTGVSASEENFKKMQNVHIVHIATHGFFTPSDDFAKLNTIAEAERMFLLKNVFLRSGLLMSGCVSDKNDNENDGILTAQEVVNTSLDNTELVVLSACETGLGEIENGEGVFGLPRAFLNAGAKNIIMSLWKVDDKLTSDLMIAFYKELLKTKIAHKALRKAQIAIRKTNPEVKYWGAFVLMSGRKF
jgi:CHAT domain-containing protein